MIDVGWLLATNIFFQPLGVLVLEEWGVVGRMGPEKKIKKKCSQVQKHFFLWSGDQYGKCRLVVGKKKIFRVLVVVQEWHDAGFWWLLVVVLTQKIIFIFILSIFCLAGRAHWL